MRACEADSEGFIEHGGVKIHYEIYGDADPTLLLMPSWAIGHKRFWKGQIPYLARHFRVVSYDGPGNGHSDRPLDPAAYDHQAQMAYALNVLDATSTDRAVVLGVSGAANWAIDLAANHAHRVIGTVLIGPAVPLTDFLPERTAHMDFDGPAPKLEPSRVPLVDRDPPTHWAKYNKQYWIDNYDDFLWFFFGQMFSESHSTKQIEDGISWAKDTTAAVLIATREADGPDAETITRWCGQIGSPLLLIHGEGDRISPLRRSEILANLTGGELVTVDGGGHLPIAQDPVAVNLLIRDFVERLMPPAPRRRTWSQWTRRPKRVLYVSSPIGL